jgi:hypothetical protein
VIAWALGMLYNLSCGPGIGWLRYVAQCVPSVCVLWSSDAAGNRVTTLRWFESSTVQNLTGTLEASTTIAAPL